MAQPTTVETELARAYQDMGAGDIEHLLELYAPDALFQGPSEPPTVGKQAIRAFWQATFDRYHVQLVPEIVETSDLGQAVVVRGRAVGALVPKNGDATVHVDSWFMQVYRRQADGTLRFWRGANGPNPK